MESSLDQLSQKYLGNSGFSVTSFGVGIGMSFEGTVGIVSGSASGVGYLAFAKREEGVRMTQDAVTESKNPGEELHATLIEDKPSGRHLSYAKATGVSTRLGHEQALYDVDLKRFKNGLEKAFKLGAFFAKPARSLNQRSWKISQILLYFQLSISGDLGLATLGGSGSVYAYFQNLEAMTN
jgi:hypothetical protein